MKWIIDAVVTSADNEQVAIHEEFWTRGESDRRYVELAMNYDEPIHVTIIK